MPNNDNRVTRFAEEWFNEEQIEEARNNSLQLERIDKNSTLADMIETVDANFREIARHGGGPAGINGLDGLNGEDGVNVEYIYALSDLMEPGVHYPTDDMGKYQLFTSAENNDSADYNGVTWYDHAQPISKEHKNEYVFSRFRRNVDTEEDDVTSWIYDTAPVLWAHWGETGQDGDGVEYIFMVSQEELSDTELGRMLKKKADMDVYEQAIFNIDDFYPGSTWFANPRNKSKAQSEFQRLGLELSDSEFEIRWNNTFGFCEYGEWTDEPTGVSPEYQYEYVSIRKSRKDENDMKIWGDYSLPALWSNYTFEGRIFIIYKNTPATEKPSVDAGTAPKKGDGWWDVANDILILNPNPNTGATPVPEGWTNNNINGEEGEITWMCSGVFDHSGKNTYWSNPSCISGKDGKNGEDGTTIEFIYALSKNPAYPRTYEDKEMLFNAVENDTEHTPKYSIYGGTKWFDRAQPISAQDTTEYMWARRREKETDPWEYDPEPIIWAHWGEDGTDGDGVEYIFAVTNVEDPSGLILPKIANLDADQQKIFQIDDFVPSRNWFAKPKSREKAVELLGESFNAARWNNYYGFDVTSGWSDDPIQVDAYVPFQWVSIRRSTADEITGDRVWEDFSDPVLWNSFGKSTRVFVIYCNMPADEEHPDREKPNKPVDGTGKWVNTESDNYLDLTDVVDALTGVTEEQKALKIGIWGDKNTDVRGTISWMCTGVFTDDGQNLSWSEPFRISGNKGEPGEDGDNMEYVYCLSPNMPAYPIPSANMSDAEYDLICSFFYNIENAKNANLNDPSDPVNEGLDLNNIHIDENGVAYYEYTGATGTTAWYDTALSIDDTPGKKTEWVWLRTKSYDDPRWSFAPAPVIWAHWGEDGTDGDGVEYIFHISQYEPLVSGEYPPEKPTAVSTDREKCKTAIYNIRDFYPDRRWFTEDTNADGIIDGKEDADAAIVETGLMSQVDFNALWNSEIQNETFFDLNFGWSDDPQETSYEYPFQYVSIRKSYTNEETGQKEWGPYSEPKLWSRHLIETRIFMVYCNVDEGITPTAPSLDYGWWGGDDRLYADETSGDPYEAPAYNKLDTTTEVGIWVDSDVYEVGKIAWICSITFAENGNAINCSEPFRITGAQGRPGADGTNIEFVYARCDNASDLKYPKPSESTYEQLMAFFDNVENAVNAAEPTIDENGKAYYDYLGTHWYDNPQGIENEEGKKIEWVWSRSLPAGETTIWTVPPKPVIWSRWGEDGTDGDGVEYIFNTDSRYPLPIDNSSNESQNPNIVFESDSTTLGKYQRIIYNIDDFYPGEDWFTTNETTAKEAITAKGETIDESTWSNIWNQLKTSFNRGWSDNPTGTDKSAPFEYVSIRKQDGNVWGEYSKPTLWSKYSIETRVFVVYCNMDNETDVPIKPQNDPSRCRYEGYWNVDKQVGEQEFARSSSARTKPFKSNALGLNYPSNSQNPDNWTNHIGYWEDNNVNVSGKIAWLCSGIFNENGDLQSWSEPFRITGAQGRPGADGSTIEFVYALSDTTPNYPAYTGNNYDAVCSFFDSVEADHNNGYEYNGTLWFDNPRGVTNEDGKRTEWVWSRSKTANNASVNWSFAPTATIWSHWGEDGTDGDGIEYIFCLQPDEWTPSSSDWTSHTSVPNNDTAKYIYDMDDFIPSSHWFTSANKTAVQEKMTSEGKTFNSTHWNNMSSQFSFNTSNVNLGTWTDNPQSLSITHPYQYVSIRKMSEGVWGPFSYPVLWGNYSASKFTAFAFTATETSVDLSLVTPTGGTFVSPYPNPTSFNGSTYTWTDGPETNPNNGRIIIWMTSAVVTEGEDISGWSTPKKMLDTEGFQVEWCSAENIPAATKQLLESNTYCFETYMRNANYDESAAETAWRTAVSNNLNLTFSDDAENAIYMATAQVKNSVWQNWKLVKVKGEQGEKGDPGTSIKVNGRIVYELYLDENVAYTKANATAKLNSSLNTLSPSPSTDNLLIVYPHNMTGDIYLGDSSNGDSLYMWKYNTSQWFDYNDPSTNGETEGSTYISPNKHLILWDGDSWQDIGEFEGPEGKSWVIVVKYANDNQNGTGKVFVSDANIPTAKWMGTLVYLDDGSDYSEALNDPNYVSTDLTRIKGWQWSLFKGQDGYGYEFIYARTNDSTSPNVPPYSSQNDYTTPNVKPSGWYDEPLEPISSYRYVWMCWRKFDHGTGRWSDFMGKEGKTSAQGGKAKLWQTYAKNIEGVFEYFHADTSISPAFPATGDMSSLPSNFESFWHSKSEVVGSTGQYGWNSTRRYLFNIEAHRYTDGTIKILEPHFISVYADGIKDITDYYCLDTDGASAPNISSQGVPTISGQSSTEGKSWWTTNASKTKIDEDYPYLWNISKKTKENGDEEWTTPIVIGVFGEGKNGENAVYLDIDNEMDAIQIDKNGTVLESKTFTANIIMYNGTSTTNIRRVEVSGEDGLKTINAFTLKQSTNGSTWYNCTEDVDYSGDGTKFVRMTLTLNAGVKLPSDYIKIQFTIKSINNEIRTANYTLVGTTNPSIYSIALSSNVIIKKENNTFDPPTLSLAVVKNTAGKREEFTSNQSGVEGGFVLSLAKNGGTASALTSYSIPTSSYVIGDKLTFTLNVDTDDTNTTPDTVMDTETVFVVGEGSGYDDNWLKTLLSGSTDITGALVMTGDLLARRSDGKIVAGVLGHNYNTNDSTNVRFFAGNTNISNLNDSTAVSFISAINSRAPFRVTEGGKLYATDAVISGEITATKLTIGGNDITTAAGASAWVNQYVSIPPSTSVSEYDDSWLTAALSKTTISGGVVATGNILVKNSSSKITAGMMGYDTTASDDIRFFAGTTVASTSTSAQIMTAAKSAPFRVDESGNMYATKGQIAGITMTSTGLSLGNIFIGNDSTYGECIKITDDDGNVNVFNAKGLRMGGSFSAKTAFLVNSLSASSTVLKNLKDVCGIVPASTINDTLLNYDIISPVGCGSLTIQSNRTLIGRRVTLICGHPLISSIFEYLDRTSGVSYSSSWGDAVYNCDFTLSSGCKFFEDGGRSSILRLQNEAVEMIGVGDASGFKGFMISRRYNITTKYDYGHELRCLGLFRIIGTTITNSVTWNGLNAIITGSSSTSSEYSVTIQTPFKVNPNWLYKIVVNVIPEGGLHFFQTELSTGSDNSLIIKIYGSTVFASNAIKVMVFNLGDFDSLKQDSSTAPYIVGSTSPTFLYWNYNRYGTSNTQSVSFTVSDSTVYIEYGIDSTWNGEQGYFAISGVQQSGHTSKTTTSSKYVTISGVYPTLNNTNSASTNEDNIRVVLHTSTTQSTDITKTIYISVTQGADPSTQQPTS